MYPTGGEDPPYEEDLPILLASDLYRYFPALFEICKRRLFFYSLLLVGNREDAEDLFQETFTKAFAALASRPAEQVEKIHLFPWLRKIAHNTSVSMQRKRKIELESYDTPEGRSFIETLEDTFFEQPETSLESREMLQKIHTLLKSLKPKYYKAVMLRHVMGLSYSEIGEELGIPAQKAKDYVSFGLKKLRHAESDLRCL
jgi:RNA polymerase sigma-70 factor (ECF subfamily)